MLGNMTKTIRVDTPIEHLIYIQPKLKYFMLQLLNPQQNNSKFPFVNSVTDNNCDNNILPYVNKNSEKNEKHKNTGVFVYLFISTYTYIQLIKRNLFFSINKNRLRKTESITQKFPF